MELSGSVINDFTLELTQLKACHEGFDGLDGLENLGKPWKVLIIKKTLETLESLKITDIWEFPKMGDLQNGWFMMENPSING